MRKHSVANSKVAVLDALFPSVRQHLLGTILAEPARWWYLSELARHLGTMPSSLQREFPLLENAGILEERREGSRTDFFWNFGLNVSGKQLLRSLHLRPFASFWPLAVLCLKKIGIVICFGSSNVR
jgi:DNA-binding transcriptional ArsR family regulator